MAFRVIFTSRSISMHKSDVSFKRYISKENIIWRRLSAAVVCEREQN